MERHLFQSQFTMNQKGSQDQFSWTLHMPLIKETCNISLIGDATRGQINPTLFLGRSDVCYFGRLSIFTWRSVQVIESVNSIKRRKLDFFERKRSMSSYYLLPSLNRPTCSHGCVAVAYLPSARVGNRNTPVCKLLHIYAAALNSTLARLGHRIIFVKKYFALKQNVLNEVIVTLRLCSLRMTFQRDLIGNLYMYRKNQRTAQKSDEECWWLKYCILSIKN